MDLEISFYRDHYLNKSTKCYKLILGLENLDDFYKSRNERNIDLKLSIIEVY